MIHIITTGGTIEGLEYDKEESKPQEVDVKIKDFLKTANVSFEYTITNVFSKDSRFIRTADREQIAKNIEACKERKILVTHGTLTMVETAKFLGNKKFDKIIVITGALVLGTETNTDAPFNLGFAIAALEFLSKGVYIAMSGKIFYWDNVIKNVQTNQFETLSE